MDERIDFSALEPDTVERELLVAAITHRAAPELARRAALDVSPIVALHDWARPALAAAAVLALICLSVLTGHEFGGVAAPGTGLTEALAVPAPVNEWLIGERSPTVADLLLAMEGDGTW
jgi:hypothetical protein